MLSHHIPELAAGGDPTLFEASGQALDVGAVDQRTRLQDLRMALNHLNSMDECAVATELNAQYGASQFNPDSIADVRLQNQQAEHDLAFAHFARASLGAAALREPGAYDTHSAQYKTAWTSFQYFKRAYASAVNEPARTEYWKQLTNQLAEIDGLDQPYPYRRPESRKPGTVTYPEKLGAADEAEYTLDTLKKVRVLSLEDDRAGFLPTTHREKNAAVSLLNYMGQTVKRVRGPDHIDDQLTEIYERQVSKRGQKYAREKEAARKAEAALAAVEGRPANFVWDGPLQLEIAEEAREVGVDSVRSVINEWDDYRANAVYSLGTLMDVKRLVTQAGNPKTKLTELLDDPEDPGLRAIDPLPLLRYLDLRLFRDTGELPPFDPLLTREIRPAPPEFTTKNKIVVEPYEYPPEYPKLGDSITAGLQAVDVKLVREIIDDAIADSRSRHLFFVRALRGIGGTYGEFARGVSRAAKTAA